MTQAGLAPGKPQALDDLMMAMDVVDTLRHREDPEEFPRDGRAGPCR